MGDIAEAMLTGVMCASCGEYLDCEQCQDMEIPMYCSYQCAIDQGADDTEDWKCRVCPHVHK